MTKEPKQIRAKGRSSVQRFTRGNVASQHTHFSPHFLSAPMKLDSDDPEVMKIFLESRIRVQETFIKEMERTRRTALWLSAALLATACVVPVFAPPEREAISYLVSVALLIFAAGAAGYGFVRVKNKEIEIVAAAADQSN
jgi:hypothetical protein